MDSKGQVDAEERSAWIDAEMYHAGRFWILLQILSQETLKKFPGRECFPIFLKHWQNH